MTHDNGMASTHARIDNIRSGESLVQAIRYQESGWNCAQKLRPGVCQQE